MARTPDNTKVVERDVEAPDVFSAQEAGLWDGRPSLGGVWVAHPDVIDPERVMIRNEANGQFVVGALFRRERATPGPRLQVSSNAAEALGLLAGQPTEINVVALRREEVVIEPDPVPEPVVTPAVASSEISAEPLDDTITAAAAALDVPAPELASAAAPAAAPIPPARPEPAVAEEPMRVDAAKPDKAFLQIGIFNVEENAKGAAETMRAAGMVPTVHAQDSNGQPFWRVVVGPATTRGEMATLLANIRAEGFIDAYAVEK